MTRKLAFVTILVLFAVVPFASAAEPNTNLRAFSAQACPTDSAKYAVDVTNPGSAPDTYTVSANVPWSTVAPSTLEVGPGETETAYVWLQPPAERQPGTYGFSVNTRSSNTGQTVTSQGQIEVLSCRAVQVSVDNPSQQVCRGETATYNVNVANTGEARETFELTATAGALDRQQVTLDPGESTQVALSAYSETETQDTLEVTAESTSSFARDSTEVEFTAETCRDAQLFVSPSDRNVCEQEAGNFSITVQNSGTTEDTYSLTTNVGGADVPSLTLQPGESQTYQVSVREDPGQHTIVAQIASQSLSTLTKSQDATLNVENCYDLILESEGNNTLQIGQTNRSLMAFGLVNNGTRANTYQMNFDGPEWTDFRPRNVTIAPGERELAFLYVAPNFFAEEGSYTSQLVVNDDSNTIQRSVDVGITVGNETIRADTDGEDRTRDGLTGRLVSRSGGLAAIILVLAALFVGGYWFFRNRSGDVLEPTDGEQAAESGQVQQPGPEAVTEATTEQERDYYRSADELLDQNANTVRRALREDNFSAHYLEILLEEERQGKSRSTVINEIQRQLDRKDENGTGQQQ